MTEFLTQDEVRQRCNSFLENTHMKTRHFCKKIGLSPEGYYNWMDCEFDIKPETMIRIMDYLNSQEARELLEERKVYKPIEACSQLTKLNENKIKRLCKDGVIDAKHDAGGHWFPNINDLQNYVYVHHPELAFKSVPHPQMLAFGSLGLDPRVSWQPVLSAHNDNEIFKPDRYEFNDPILISSDGRLFNCRTRNLIAAKPNQKGYIRTNLPKGKKTVTVDLHVMTAYFFCPNRRFVREVHHLNHKKHDNRACNLLWCTPKEHDELHRLWDTDKKAYWRYVNQIRRENKW